jgi:hypothetical protein
MYENEKMKPIKLLQEWGERGLKENDGGDGLKYDIFGIVLEHL